MSAVELLWTAWRSSRLEGGWIPSIGYVLVAIVAGVGAVWFIKKTIKLHRQARSGGLPITLPGESPEGPPAEPDFSTLGDGKDRWQNLHDVR
jgi:hypothetical protein